MLRDQPFENGETYHIFNRGAHKRDIFISSEDYNRFLLLAYLGNSQNPVNIRQTLIKHKGSTFDDVFLDEEVSEPLVEVLGYALMPNHYHLILRQKRDLGISTFMKKLGTGYTMSYNTKYDHSGVVFQGRFKSRHVGSEPYFRYIFAYVHLNPVALVEPGWKLGQIENPEQVRDFLKKYRHSSYYDYSIKRRPQSKVLSLSGAPDFLTTQNDLEEMLKDLATSGLSSEHLTKVQPL